MTFKIIEELLTGETKWIMKLKGGSDLRITTRKQYCNYYRTVSCMSYLYGSKNATHVGALFRQWSFSLQFDIIYIYTDLLRLSICFVVSDGPVSVICFRIYAVANKVVFINCRWLETTYHNSANCNLLQRLAYRFSSVSSHLLQRSCEWQ